MDLEALSGQMVECIKEIGLKENNMELAFFILQMVTTKLGFGKKGREKSGLLMRMNFNNMKAKLKKLNN